MTTIASSRSRARISRRGFVAGSAAMAAAFGFGRPWRAAAQEKVSIVWSTWGTPEELKRVQQFDDEFMKRHPNIELKLVPIPSYDEYHPKIMTQLGAGQGPDVFYVGDDNIGKFVESGALLDLTDLVNGPDSKTRPEEFFPGLWGAAKTTDDRIFGVTNDCNPQVLWFNKPTLAAAGITDDPIALRDAGKWTWDAWSAMLDKLKAAGKHGAILENWFADTYSLIAANGGKVYDDGKFVATEDPKSVAALKFIADGVKNKVIENSDFLPEGQGEDALFISGLAGFGSAGRWFLPTLKDALPAGDYDIVTWPTTTGKPIEPTGVATSFMVINKNGKHQPEAFQFLTEFASKDGQLFRLQGGGNAVPSIQGVDQVVSEDNLPPHSKSFLQARDTGFVWPAEETRVAGLPQDIIKGLEPLWLGQGDFDATINALGEMVNKRLAGQSS
ncbi:MAG TPA: sugar ABC transporter substrate-binding protein [Thermomicrobiales bacterium]|nr:sugar ABC transporter substrate-binding protein [Thermomicrobiales bacterium]